MHLALKPGTDVVLAWALAAELERLGGFDDDFIRQHVLGRRRLHGAGPAVYPG